jgi:hypothetical protein
MMNRRNFSIVCLGLMAAGIAGAIFMIQKIPIIKFFRIDLSIDGTYLDENAVLAKLAPAVDPLKVFFDLQHFESLFTDLPQMQSVSIHRRGLRTLFIEMTLRQPVLRLMTDSFAMALDKNARPFLCDDPLVEDLPAYHLVAPPSEMDFLQPGDSLGCLYRLAVSLAVRNQAVWSDFRDLDGSKPDEINLRDPENFNCIRLSYRNPERRLGCLEEFLSEYSSYHDLEFDLRFPDYMIIRSFPGGSGNG